MATDAEIDAEARAYMRAHDVSYAEAVSTVAVNLAGSGRTDRRAAFAESHSDAELHERACRIMRETCVSYAEAISQVVTAFSAFQEPPSPLVAASGTDLSDHEIDAQARRYAQQHGLSYVDALTHVTAGIQAPPPASYAERAIGLTDAEIDQRAKRYAHQHGVNYVEALSATCSMNASFREQPVCIAFSEAVQTMEGRWVDIFSAGSHMDDSGTVRTFSPADIAEMVAAYRPSVREAPLVVGHPETDGPAHGWVAALRSTPDGVLQMNAKQVSAGFADAVRAGRFKKRSSAFYTPSHPGNPSPGKWYLRHVGFLGAQQPAIAGLNDIRF